MEHEKYKQEIDHSKSNVVKICLILVNCQAQIQEQLL